MNLAARRAEFKNALQHLGAPVRFRGEELPDIGVHVVIDMITDTPVESLDTRETGSFTVLQVTCWAEKLSAALTLDQKLRAALEANGWFRTGPTRFPVDPPFSGVQSDYRDFTPQEQP